MTQSSLGHRRRKKIVALASSEHHQANIVLAVIYELLLLQKCEIHIVSFKPLETRINELNVTIEEHAIPALFHLIKGPSATESLPAENEFIGPCQPGVTGAIDTYRTTLPAVVNVWGGRIYVAGYKSCLKILCSVQPDLIVVDPLMSQGLDACRTLRRKHVLIGPITLQELLRNQKPILSKPGTPALSSGFPYPLPWSSIPSNIYLTLMMFWCLMDSPTMKNIMKFRKSQMLSALPPAFDLWQQGNHYLLSTAPDVEYPCDIPSNITPCGPILFTETPIERGPELLL